MRSVVTIVIHRICGGREGITGIGTFEYTTVAAYIHFITVLIIKDYSLDILLYPVREMVIYIAVSDTGRGPSYEIRIAIKLYSAEIGQV